MTTGSDMRYATDWTISGRPLGAITGKPPKTYPLGRRCSNDDCNHKLGSYNPGPTCHSCGPKGES